MTGKRLLVHSAFLLLLPVLVAWLGLSVAAAAAIVLAALLWRWLISLSVFLAPARVPELELVTISASHFVEKVRWCMDRLGVDYTENPAGGTLGAFFLGRTVPLLRARTGAVQSTIGNSPEILRYLWGRYSVESGGRAAFLEPTGERLAFEIETDRAGVDLQTWVYFHILQDRKLTLHAWGANDPDIPAWQRATLKLAFPVMRFLIRKSFRITPGRHARAVSGISALLGDVEEKLQDGRKSILGGDLINYTDLAFAAILGLAFNPAEFGGGKADAVRIEFEDCPETMRQEIGQWRTDYPRAAAYVGRLYEEQRLEKS